MHRFYCDFSLLWVAFGEFSFCADAEGAGEGEGEGKERKGRGERRRGGGKGEGSGRRGRSRIAAAGEDEACRGLLPRAKVGAGCDPRARAGRGSRAMESWLHFGACVLCRRQPFQWFGAQSSQKRDLWHEAAVSPAENVPVLEPFAAMHFSEFEKVQVSYVRSFITGKNIQKARLLHRKPCAPLCHNSRF